MNFKKLLFASLAFTTPAFSEVTMTSLDSFSGDGWIVPLGDWLWLSDTLATERSIAYSKKTNHLYVTNRSIPPGTDHIRILDADTGVEVATETSGLDMTGVTGGFFYLSAVSVASDGAIYACNLLTAVTEASPFKIYRWADESSVASVAFTSGTITATRMGDTLDVFGGDTSTLLVAGEGNTGTVGSRNGYVVMRTDDGLNFTGSLVSFTGTNPAAGDFRAGITFTDVDSVIGSQGVGGFKFTSFSGTTGTLELSKVLTNAQERPMDYIVLGGKPLLATLETNGNVVPPAVPAATFSTVRVYDLSDPANPVRVAEGRTATTYYSQGTSGPGTGSVAWGKVTGNSAKLYALSTNNGIQAFTVTVPDETPFVISSVNLNAAAGKLAVSWRSSAGHTYRVEYSGDLTAWSVAATALPADASSTNTYEWTVPANLAGRAYVRIVQE